jgi:hypothetical protein
MREAYGQFWAYLYGWTMMLVVFPGSIAALTSTFLLYLQWFVPLTWWAKKALGIGLLHRPYRVVGYPFTVLVFVTVSTVFVVTTLIESTLSSLMGLGLLLVGIPFYKKRKVSAPFGIPKSGSGSDC